MTSLCIDFFWLTWFLISAKVRSFVLRNEGLPSPAFCPSSVLSRKNVLLLLRCEGQKGQNVEPAIKDKFLNFLAARFEDQDLPCGLAATPKERKQVGKGVEALIERGRDCNKVSLQQGKIQATDILGTWNLLYTSSRTMGINKSLSGLGRSASEKAKFTSLRHIFTGSKFLGFVEFVELIGGDEDTDDSAVEVRITGEWTLEPQLDPILGQPSTSIRCDLERIAYGNVSNKAEDWSSLGPVKLVDVVFLDEDLLVTRGNVNPDTLFVYQKQN